METSSDTIVQDGRRYLGEQDKSSQPPGIHRSPQVFPSPYPLLLRAKDTNMLSVPIGVPLPHGRNSVTLHHLESSHLESEKYKQKTPNQMPWKSKGTTVYRITGIPGFAKTAKLLCTLLYNNVFFTEIHLHVADTSTSVHG